MRDNIKKEIKHFMRVYKNMKKNSGFGCYLESRFWIYVRDYAYKRLKELHE